MDLRFNTSLAEVYKSGSQIASSYIHTNTIMKEYIFYTTEGFSQAPDGDNIENCQLLGCACGIDKQDALQNLLKENSWIEQRGFTFCNAIGKELAK